jgi:hypothetical protein
VVSHDPNKNCNRFPSTDLLNSHCFAVFERSVTWILFKVLAAAQWTSYKLLFRKLNAFNSNILIPNRSSQAIIKRWCENRIPAKVHGNIKCLAEYKMLDLQINYFPSAKNLPVQTYITCKRGSAKHRVKDDHAFLWKHAIFSHLPIRNPSTDQQWILHDW